jgi:hypothetical protein
LQNTLVTIGRRRLSIARQRDFEFLQTFLCRRDVLAGALPGCNLLRDCIQKRLAMTDSLCLDADGRRVIFCSFLTVLVVSRDESAIS